MKYLATIPAVLLATAAFAAANDTLISFSTPGPDAYANGERVLDGECYALVWTTTNAVFAGFAADGTAVDPANNAILVYAPVAKDGRCPLVVFELDAEFAERYAHGTYAVYLLDTRLANGKVGGLGANGVPVAIDGYGEVTRADGGGVSGGSCVSLAAEADASPFSTAVRSALPVGTPQPQITAMRLLGDNVYLTVKNTLPCLRYAASAVTASGEDEGDRVFSPVPDDNPSPTQGGSSLEEEITVITPKKGDSAFYSVGRD